MKSRTNTPQIDYRPISDLKPYGSSARVHPAGQKRKLIELLRRHGQITPVIIDPAGVIIDGQRAGSSFTCALVWATDGVDHFLVEVLRDRLLYPDLVDRLLGLTLHYGPRNVLIEDASVGAALIPHFSHLLLQARSKASVKAVRRSELEG